MNKIRTFVAVDLPQDIKMEVDRFTSAFRNQGRGIRWVNAQNLHLTLRFLGDIPEDSVPRLADNIKKNVDGFGVFDLSLSGLGGFPNLKRPRVIWTGVEIGKDKLRDLAAGMETACIESEFGNGDKRFSPHLTIGRVKNPAGLGGILEKIGRTSFKTEPFVVYEVTIFKSDLSPAGPKYTSLAKIQL